MYYIRNTKTDQNYDIYEDKFFESDWSPEYSVDKKHLKLLIKTYPEKFKDCVIEKA